MLRHSNSRFELTKNDRRNRGRETSNVWVAVYVAIIYFGDSSGDSRLETIPKVFERMSMTCVKEMP